MRAKAWRLENSAALRPKAHPTHARQQPMVKKF